MAVMGGQVTHVTEVPPATVAWALPWEGLLTVELAWHQQTPGQQPDGVLVHRKRKSRDDGCLVYDVRCRWGLKFFSHARMPSIYSLCALHHHPILHGTGNLPGLP